MSKTTNEAVITIKIVRGLCDKWGAFETLDGRVIGGKVGYFRSLMDKIEVEFGERPEVNGLKIRIANENDALVLAIFFRGIWIKDKTMQRNWNQK